QREAPPSAIPLPPPAPSPSMADTLLAAPSPVVPSPDLPAPPVPLAVIDDEVAADVQVEAEADAEAQDEAPRRAEPLVGPRLQQALDEIASLRSQLADAHVNASARDFSVQQAATTRQVADERVAVAEGAAEAIHT